MLPACVSLPPPPSAFVSASVMRTCALPLNGCMWSTPKSIPNIISETRRTLARANCCTRASLTSVYPGSLSDEDALSAFSPDLT